MQNKLNTFLKLLVFSILFLNVQIFSQFPSLTLAPGARQLGMGEAFVGLADDVYATFFNPAGLAFAPLSDEWSLERKFSSRKKVLLTSYARRSLFSTDKLWLVKDGELFFFNGKLWESDYTYRIKNDENLASIVEKHIGTRGNLEEFIETVRKYNGFKENQEIKKVKLPYNLLFKNQVVYSSVVDKNQRLWVGTNKGLYRFNGSSWKDLSSVFDEGTIIKDLAIEKANIWIATTNGLYRYRSGRFSVRGAKILPQKSIVSIATHPSDDFIYVAYQGGVARYRPPKQKKQQGKWKLFSKKDGIFSDTIVDMALDEKGHLWVAHYNAVSHYNLLGWKRTLFNQYELQELSVDEDNQIWLTTNQGVWKNDYNYKDQKNRWTHFHIGNSLKSNNSSAASSIGEDTWFVTEAGVEKHSAARSHVAFFFESLLPALQIDNLFHAFLAFSFPLFEWGTFGGFVNFLSLGSVAEENQDAASPGVELAAALSYGTKLTQESSIGLNFKFLYVSLGSGAIQSGSGIAVSYAFDLAFLFKNFLVKGLHFGINLQNIGPGVSFVDQSQEDPLPFTWKFGLAYEVFEFPKHELTFVADFNREAFFENRSATESTPVVVGAFLDLKQPFGRGDSRNNDFLEVLKQNLRRSIYNLGVEYVYAKVVALRTGLLIDLVGERREIDLGVGFFVSNSFEINGAFLRDIGSGVRTGQFRVDLLFSF